MQSGQPAQPPQDPSYGQAGQQGPTGPGPGWPPAGQPYGGQPGGGQPYGGQPGDGPYAGQPPYGGPQQGFASAQWQPEPKRRGKLIPLIVALAVLIVFGGGGAFAYSRLNGGDQPSAVLPGTAVAYARVDLNPSAGQRVAALRFLMKFPSVRDEIGLTSDNDDLHQKLFELLKKNAGDDLAEVDFDRDVKPWLGDRLAVAAVPSHGLGKPDPVIAVQVKDEDKARAGLDKLFADEKDKPGLAFVGKYAILGEDQAKVDSAVAVGKDNPLESNEKFSHDLSDLGEQGFASFWADTRAAAELAGDKLTDQQRAALPVGSAAAVLRFDSQYVELKAVMHGGQTLTPTTTGAGDVVATLPGSTAAALAISDGESLVGTIWDQLQKSLAGSGIKLGELTKGFSEEYGLTLPDDLKPLLGKSLALAVDKESGDLPKIAARIETDPAKAEAVVDKVTALVASQTGADVPIEKAKDGDTLVLATDKGYADKVLKGGNLGQTDNFRQAVPDAKGALMLGYVDFEAARSLNPEFGSNKDLAVLRSAGCVVRITGDAEADLTLRLVAK